MKKKILRTERNIISEMWLSFKQKKKNPSLVGRDVIKIGNWIFLKRRQSNERRVRIILFLNKISVIKLNDSTFAERIGFTEGDVGEVEKKKGVLRISFL